MGAAITIALLVLVVIIVVFIISNRRETLRKDVAFVESRLNQQRGTDAIRVIRQQRGYDHAMKVAREVMEKHPDVIITLR